MKKVRNGNGDNQELNIIANGTSITGDITSGGDFRIEGSVKGKIETKGRIVVGESGVVVGELACTNADIMGNVNIRFAGFSVGIRSRQNVVNPFSEILFLQ